MLEPLRPLFFWLAGNVQGFNLFLLLRVAVLFAAMGIAAKSTLVFEWAPRDVPIAIKSADPLLTLRGFACLIVLIGHATITVFPPANLAELVQSKDPFHWLMPCPWVGVWIFFVLSGYLMGKGFYAGRYELNREGISRFYLNRLLRIAPVYWLAILIVAIASRRDVFEGNNLFGLISSLLFFQQTEMPFTVIGALWSVQTEMGFYLIAPFFFVAIATSLSGRVRPMHMVASFIATGFVYRVAVLAIAQYTGLSLWNVAISTPTIANFDLFATGLITNWLVSERKFQNIPVISVPLICLSIFFCSAFLFPEGEFGVNPKPYLGALAVFGPVIVAASVLLGIILIETKGPQGLLVRSTQWFGILTYAIYVCHEPVYTAVRRLAPQKLDIPQSLVWLGIAILLSGSVAVIAYVLVERPFDRARQR
jgi:peptidoglycan/LPS O-acetylase OafA/YrhL